MPNSEEKLAENINIGESRLAEACPYCNSKDFIKRGTRKNKLQVVQLYECKNEECGRTFTAQDVRGKHFPLNVIIEGMSYYNLGFTLEQSCSFLKQKSGNASSGNYMISVDGHKIYLKTGRDFSSLIGKQVNVSYTGE